MAATQLALFDFDGTITTRDTMLAFCRHARGTPRYILGMIWLVPVFALMVFKVIPNHRAKEMMLGHFLGGQPRAQLQAWASSFVPEVEGWVRPAALERIAWHQQQGHRLLMVSASLDLWLKPWAEAHGLELLCTEGAFVDERFTGALATPNCHGAEKVRRIEQVLDLSDYEEIYAYGDSSGDTEMLAVATEPHFKPFR